MTAVRAQMVYTTGQRTMFLFPITLLWLLGPTAMVCASVVITGSIAYLDRWDPRWRSNYATVLQSVPSRASLGNRRSIHGM